MTRLKGISFKILISITIIISALAIECPSGFDSVPPGRPFGICVILGCARPVKDQLCTVDCVQGYTKTSDKKCEVTKCISNSKTTCSACQVGFQLKAQTFNPILRVCVPSNCLTFDQSTRECKVCQKGFLLDKKGTCGLPNCLQPSRDQSQCTVCKQGYTITQIAEGIGLCVPKNCQIYSPSTYQCNKCQASYILTESYNCKLGVQNCTDFNQFSGLCYKCQEGFKLMALRNCVKQNPFCLEYGDNGCTLCQYPYRAISGGCQPNFCEQFNKNNKSQCSRCEIGFKLNGKKLCEVENCESFDQKIPKCTKCTDMYELASVESAIIQKYVVQKCLSKYCIKYDKKTSLCLECNPEFTLKEGSCIFSNCNKMGYSSCQECVDGWTQNERGNCVNYDCLQFDDLRSCKSCRSEKRLYKGTCIKDNCVLRNPETNKCAQCSLEYFIHPKFDQYCVVPFCAKIDESSGDCLECYPNFKFNSKNFCESAACLSYEKKKQLINPTCSSCIEGYEPENEYCIGSKKYCLQYSLQEGKCKKCTFRYELSADNLTCNPIKCKQLTIKSTFSLCQLCNLGYSVISFENGTQKCEANNCTKVQNYLCQQCAHGFSLLSDICLTDNCKSFVENSGLCKECLDGFYLNISTLTCSREKCLQQNKDTCKKCEDGYFVDVNDNSETRGLCIPFNCEVVKFFKRNESNFDFSFVAIKCQKCKNDFIFMPNQKCLVKDCNKIDEITGFCNECLPGFNLMKDGKCSIYRNNEFCPERSYPDDRFSCRPMKAKNCISANPKNTSQCYKCEENFYLKSGTCRNFAQCVQKNPYLGCLRCEIGYKLNENQECQSTFPNCQLFDAKTAQCQQCLIGYQIVLYPNKKCFAIPDSCALLDPWGNCTQCRFPNRVLNEGICVIPTNNCVKYEATNGLCMSCNQGYYKKVDNGSYCIKNPNNCDTVNQKGQCTKCADSYIFTSGGCYSKIDKCAYYSFQKCTLCQSGYFVDSTGANCRELPKYCDKVILNTDGICQKCTERFANVNGRCVRMIDYCDQYQVTTGKCLACQSGYSLAFSKQICLFGIV